MTYLTKSVIKFLLLFTLPLTLAHATIIDYTTTALNGSQWRYDYVIHNDTLGALEEFTIYFDEALYGQVLNVSGPAGWDLLTVQPDIGLPAAGYFDAMSFIGGISGSSAVGGFAVTFDYLGAGDPGAQRFSIIDPLSFAQLDSGMTHDAAAIPIPATPWLMLGGTLAILWRRSRKGRIANPKTTFDGDHQ